MDYPSPLYNPTSVLVVEDNRDAADSLARFLRVSAGFYVRVAYDGKTAVRMALDDPPIAVVCDIVLPMKNGLTVAEQLIAQLDEKPLLVAVTAFGDVCSEVMARAAGFHHYLVKPADPFEIERLITEHVDGRLE